MSQLLIVCDELTRVGIELLGQLKKKLPWSIVTSKAGLAHTGSIVNDQSLNSVTHLVELSCWTRGGWNEVERMLY